jgi:rod shape determining protein RodA
MRRFFNFDWLILILVLAIGLIGLLAVKSIAPTLFLSQLIWFILGLGLFFLFSQINYQVYQRAGWYFYFGSLIFLLVTFIFGQVTRGAVRWIQIGSFNLQPSEIVKPFLILFFASFFGDEQEKSLKRLLQSFGFLILPVLLIFLQPDLGSSLVVFFIWLGMVLARGIKIKWLFFGGGFLAIFLPLAFRFLKDYQKQRIYTFLNPQGDPLGSGFNVIQSMIAVGSGKIFGRGLGRGTQSHLRFLPEKHTDFIFASLAEEIGFLGVLVLLGLFFFLLWRILILAKNASDQFAHFICIGVFSLLFIQIFINIGMNLGILPITGITLPLISYGGSSLVSTMVALGIISSLNRFKERKDIVEIR